MQATSGLTSFEKGALLRLVFSGGLGLVLAAQFACGGNTGTQGSGGAPRLVMLYATCTVNKDYLSPYNPSVKFTPNIERFSRESVVFSRHTAESAQSGIAYASIYSGTQADKHGVFYHPRMLSEDLYLVAEAFAENDYETFFWDGHHMASSRLRYSQGVQDGNVIGTKLL